MEQVRGPLVVLRPVCVRPCLRLRRSGQQPAAQDHQQTHQGHAAKLAKSVPWPTPPPGRRSEVAAHVATLVDVTDSRLAGPFLLPLASSALVCDMPTSPFPIAPPIEPMLAKLATEVPDGDGFLFEPKWDGFRAIVFRGGGRGLHPKPRPASRSIATSPSCTTRCSPGCPTAACSTARS